MQAKTLFIEGLPGAGKSTVGNYLATTLIERGLPVRLILESDGENPFRYGSGTEPDLDPDVFVQAVQEMWRSFVSKRSAENSVLIQESMTIQQQVNFLVWMNREDLLSPLMKQIYSYTDSFKPHLIYLRQSNPVGAFQKTMKLRGEQWTLTKVAPLVDSPFGKDLNLTPSETTSAFIEKIHHLTDRLVDEFPGPKSVLDVTDRVWPRTCRELDAVLSSI